MTDIFIKVPNGRHFRQDGLEKGSRPQERSKRLAPPERKERKARGCGDRGRHGNFQSTGLGRLAWNTSLGTRLIGTLLRKSRRSRHAGRRNPPEENPADVAV